MCKVILMLFAGVSGSALARDDYIRTIDRIATWLMGLFTKHDCALAFSLNVAPLSPWMIFAVPTLSPNAFASVSASIEAISLSERDNCFLEQSESE